MFGLGHSIVAAKRLVLDDLFYVIRHSTSADQRTGLLERIAGKLQYLVFQS